MYQQPLLELNTAKPSKRLISLTPLIDVVFILLVFFMLASNFIEWSSINVGVAPVSEIQGFNEKESMLLEVAESEYYFNGVSIAKAEISQHMLAHLQTNPEAILHIQAKDKAPIQRVISILDLVQKEGIRDFTLVPDPEWKADVQTDTLH